jgi:hypothetical protein
MNIPLAHLQPLLVGPVMRYKRSSILHCPLIDDVKHHRYRFLGRDRTLEVRNEGTKVYQHFFVSLHFLGRSCKSDEYVNWYHSN